MSGVFGILGKENVSAAELTFLGLYALQHRGQESAGITVSDGKRVRVHKGMGLVSQVFDDDILRKLPGSLALGHVRYSSAGVAHAANTQPLLALSHFGQLAIAHNGNLTNAKQLREALMQKGALFQTTTDSEVVLNLIATSGTATLEQAVVAAAQALAGAFALVIMGNNQLIGLRDPMGNRPLVLGRLNGAYILASETCALSTIGAERVRDVEPGEMIIIDQNGCRSRKVLTAPREAVCVFEYIYFSRQDSELGDKNIHLVRKEIGRVLAKEYPVDADVVIPAPDSAISAAMGYAEELGIPYEVGLIKNRYVGRTFIQPTDAMRKLGARIKLNPIHPVLEGKRVVLLDDSIVRGTTTAQAIRLLRESGAKEVHMVVASPPFAYTCHYGINVPKPGELIASSRSIDEIREQIDADSLHYLSLEGLNQALGITEDRLCNACFSGNYPTPVHLDDLTEDLLEEPEPIARA